MRIVIIGLIAFALLTAGGTAFLVKRLLDTPTTVADEVQEDTTPISGVFVLVADSDLPAGTTIARSNVRWQPWPKDAVDNKFISADTEDRDIKNEFVGAVVRRGILAGTPFNDAMVFRRDNPGFLAGALSPGMRAVAIPVTVVGSGVAGFILPGDSVDIVLTHDIRKDYQPPSGDGTSTPVIAGSIVRYTSETIVRNAHVIAVDQSFNDLEGEAIIVKTVTVEVTSKQVEVIATAKAMGEISLSLRSLADDAAQDTKGIFTTDVEISPTLAKTFGNHKAKKETTPRPASRSTSSKLKVKVYRGSTSTTQVFPNK
jgi:pilus assembly protein CpaB